MIPFQVRSYGPCSTSQCLQDTYEGPTKAEVGVQADNNFVAHFRNERNHRLGQRLNMRSLSTVEGAKWRFTAKA